jgi:hypothetical protein
MDIQLQKRCEFVISLLIKLKDINKDLIQLGSAIESCTEDYYRKVFEENRHEIQKEVSTHNNNCEKVSFTYNEIISKINEWYNFVRNQDEIRRVTFPIKFINKKRKLKSFISNANDDISGKTIENRFIREHLSSRYHEIELMAIQLINEGKDYKCYLQFKKAKEELVSELKYLLPTVSDSHHIEIDLSAPEKLIEELNNCALRAR